MPAWISVTNVPPRATVCQIFMLFSELKMEPEEITMMIRRRDSAVFEIKNPDLARRAVQSLNGKMLYNHFVCVVLSSAEQLKRFRDVHVDIAVDVSCYVSCFVDSLPKPPSEDRCPDSTDLGDYNEQMIRMINSVLIEYPASPRKRKVDSPSAVQLENLAEPNGVQSGIIANNGLDANILADNQTMDWDPTEMPLVMKSKKRKLPGDFNEPDLSVVKRLREIREMIPSSELLSTVPKIEFQSTISASKCSFRWGLPLDLDVAVQLLDVTDGTGALMYIPPLGRINEYDLKTVPGQKYMIKLHVFDSSNTLIGRGEFSFKATFSMEEMNRLLELALKFAGDLLHPYQFLYRCKPRKYYDDIYATKGRIMKPYLKDNNGQAASPINNAINGLFFSARLLSNGELPPSSPFGDVRMQIPVGVLLAMNEVNMYFSDFYCNSETSLHYITLVICKKKSEVDLYCRDRLILLPPTDNNFLKVVLGSQGNISFCVNLKVWVEIYYTEEISLFNATILEKIETIGRGYSKKDGLPHNKECEICNLYPMKKKH